MRTILIADNTVRFRASLALALQFKGYTVISANDGHQAWELLESQKIDLLVTELMMPQGDGVTLLKRKAAHPTLRSVPVIVCTGSSNRRHILEVACLGVRDYLVKSANVQTDILARIESRLNIQHEPPREVPPAKPPAGATTVQPARISGSSQQAAAAPAVGSSAPATTSPVAAAPRAGATADAEAPALSPLEALKTLKPIVTRAQMEETIARCGEIKALSPTVSQLIKLCSSPNCSIEQVVRIVRQDQAIALKILKLANSVVYTRGEPVDSVHKAVARIGLEQIRQAVLNISVIEQFSLNDLGSRLSSAPFWEHCIAVGLIAAELVHARGGSVEEADHAFTSGLLHDVGRMVYAQEIPELYTQVINAADRLMLPLEQVESRMLLINHADMMEKLLTSWRLPRPLIAPIGMHHLSMGNVRQLAPHSVSEIGTLVLANAMAHALLLGSSGNEAIYATGDLVAGLGVPERVVAEIVAKIPDQTQDIKLTMLSRAQSQSWTPLAQQLRERIGVPLRPLVLSVEPQTDAVAIFARRLGGAETGEGPNVAIAHIGHGRDRVPLSEKLRKAEVELGTPNLPLVVFSAAGTLGLDDRIMAGRRAARLPVPCALSRFAGAIQEILTTGEPGAVNAAA